jgi:hypothetical protein
MVEERLAIWMLVSQTIVGQKVVVAPFLLFYSPHVLLCYSLLLLNCLPPFHGTIVGCFFCLVVVREGFFVLPSFFSLCKSSVPLCSRILAFFR